MGTLSVKEGQHVTGSHFHTGKGDKDRSKVCTWEKDQTTGSVPVRGTPQSMKTNLGPWGELPDCVPQEVPDKGPRLLVYDLDINMLTGPLSREDLLMVGMSITWRGAGSGACSERHPCIVSWHAKGVAGCLAVRHSAGYRGFCEAWFEANAQETEKA